MSSVLLKPKKTVDLHAETFIDIEKYEIDEYLNESVMYMREQLDAAIYWEYPEIKFVHGKGRGVLRDAIYQELRNYRTDGLISGFHPSYSNPDIVVVVLGL